MLRRSSLASITLATLLISTRSFAAQTGAPMQTSAPVQVPVSAPAPSPTPDAGLTSISLQELKRIRDPFKRPPMAEHEEGPPKSELETIPVSDLAMVGVVTGPHKVRALVRSPSGSVFSVSDGTRIGTQNGYVRKVLGDRIIINEFVQDLLGEKEVITTELKINGKGVERGVSSGAGGSGGGDTHSAPNGANTSTMSGKNLNGLGRPRAPGMGGFYGNGSGGFPMPMEMDSADKASVFGSGPGASGATTSSPSTSTSTSTSTSSSGGPKPNVGLIPPAGGTTLAPTYGVPSPSGASQTAGSK